MYQNYVGHYALFDVHMTGICQYDNSLNSGVPPTCEESCTLMSNRPHTKGNTQYNADIMDGYCHEPLENHVKLPHETCNGSSSKSWEQDGRVQFLISSSASCSLRIAGTSKKKKLFPDVTIHEVQDQ
jgi:hypothetical protein